MYPSKVLSKVASYAQNSNIFSDICDLYWYWLFCLVLLVLLLLTLFNSLAFQSFDLECTWYRLFQKCAALNLISTFLSIYLCFQIIFLRHRWPTSILTILFRPLGFVAPTDFQVLWLSNLLTLSVSETRHAH